MAFGAEIRRGDSRDILEHFARVGADLYPGDDPAAPTAAKTSAHLAPDHPTRRRCEVQLLIVDGPSGHGRVAAIVNPRLLDDEGRPIGLCGFFESDEREDTAKRLLGEACEWLDKRGCAIVRGPMNYSSWHDYRFVVESEVTDWIPGEPYHHARYPGLWRAAGFTEAGTYSTNWLGDPGPIIDRFAGRAEKCRAAGYSVRAIDPDRDLDALYAISVEAFAPAWMYSPIERDEFAALYTPAQAARGALTSYLALSPAGDAIGFMYTFPTTIGERGPVLICKSIAVVPGHQDRRPYHLLVHTWFSEQREAGYRHFVAALMHCEGSPALMGWTRPETRMKEYELYERRL